LTVRGLSTVLSRMQLDADPHSVILADASFATEART
jgi:hypothetical protein